MTDEMKRKVQRLKDDTISPKSRLIEVWESLLGIGAQKEADQLGAIIARLESWQNR